MIYDFFETSPKYFICAKA